MCIMYDRVHMNVPVTYIHTLYTLGEKCNLKLFPPSLSTFVNIIKILNVD